MSYEDALQYLEAFINYELIPFYNYRRSLKLDRMKRFLALLGNPHKDLGVIHIAGSKGKGSTAAMISSILKEAGFRTGLYTSPHLISFRERIKLNGNEIPKNSLAEIIDRMRPLLKRMKKHQRPTFFELCTAVAFVYFKSVKTDFTVLEVGLGGRLDATNVVDANIAAISPISLEHTHKLGTRLGQIAFEKSGVIKKDAFCITAPQDQEALTVLEDICRRRNASLSLVGRDIVVEEDGFNDFEQRFRIWGKFGEYSNLRLRLLGRHQLINAAVAVGLAESLRTSSVFISGDSIKKGLFNADWPGRMEVVSRNPLIVLDGAQNAASARALAESVVRHFRFKRLILILAMSRDKDIRGVLCHLKHLADDIIITKVKNPRAARPHVLRRHLKAVAPSTVAKDSSKALDIARSRAGKDDLILVTGSLFLVGELKEALGTCKT